MSEQRQILTASQNKKASIGCLWMFGAALIFVVGAKVIQTVSERQPQTTGVMVASAAEATAQAEARRKADEDTLRAEAPAMIADGRMKLAHAFELLSARRVKEAIRHRARITDPDRRRGAPSSVMKIRKDTPRIWRIFSADEGDASALKRVSYLRAMPYGCRGDERGNRAVGSAHASSRWLRCI